MESNTTAGPNPPGLGRWVLTGALYGVIMGVMFSLQWGSWTRGMIGGFLGGVFFGFGMKWFASRRLFEREVERPDFGAEEVLLGGPANHFKHAEAVGGYLWLTSGALFFRSHRWNIQNHECEIPLSEIVAVEAARTLRLIPNGLRVRTAAGAEERFVVWKNAEWVSAIMRAKERGGEFPESEAANP